MTNELHRDQEQKQGKPHLKTKLRLKTKVQLIFRRKGYTPERNHPYIRTTECSVIFVIPPTAVDRDRLIAYITDRVENSPGIEVVPSTAEGYLIKFLTTVSENSLMVMHVGSVLQYSTYTPIQPSGKDRVYFKLLLNQVPFDHSTYPRLQALFRPHGDIVELGVCYKVLQGASKDSNETYRRLPILRFQCCVLVDCTPSREGILRPPIPAYFNIGPGQKIFNHVFHKDGIPNLDHWPDANGGIEHEIWSDDGGEEIFE